MPLLQVTWRLQSPGQKLWAVVKPANVINQKSVRCNTTCVESPEHVVIILDIVLVEQHVQLLQHERVVQLQRVPLEAGGQRELLLADLGHRHVGRDPLVAGDDLVNARHGLRGPELVTLLSCLLLILGWTCTPMFQSL